MERPYELPHILRLSDISLQDDRTMKNIFENRLLDIATSNMEIEESSTSSEQHIFDKIPTLFTGLETWPYQTNLHCWVCGFAFTERPKFVPTYLREGREGGIEIGVLGNMCSFNCAESWIQLQLAGRENSEERWRAQENLRILLLIFTGYWVDIIIPSPPRTETQQYGGKLDGKKYRKKIQELDPVFLIRSKDPHTHDFTNQGRFASENIGTFLGSTGSRLRSLRDTNAFLTAERMKYALDLVGNRTRVHSKKQSMVDADNGDREVPPTTVSKKEVAFLLQELGLFSPS